MARLDPRSKRALIALAIIAVTQLVGDAMVIRGGPIRTWTGSAIMCGGLLGGISLLVFSMFAGRKRPQ